MRLRSYQLFIVWSILCGAWTAHIDADEPASIADFNRDIRPILSDNCYLCHGPDEANRKAGLRLDQRDLAVKAAESGDIALVPGKPELSELILRVTSTDENLRMPPAKGNKKPLSAGQIDLLKRWVEQGAEYNSHWAFRAPERPMPPDVPASAGSVRNEIDRFVLAKIAAANLKPAAEADKITLLRRLSLDLIGLPPTIAQVDTFLADTSFDAYEKQVDRLLASQHYGERWGRHWLDAARYADSDGFEKDKSRQVYFFRDYVINSLNNDLPYDQFVIEQLAGDLLPNATQDQTVATGFLRNSMLNEEGGVDPEQFRMDAMFDRMDAIGKTFLGLTIQCSQCHNHKFDPLTQEEYYRLFAFVNNDHESQRVVYSLEEQKVIAELTRQIAAKEAELQSDPKNADWQQRIAAWEEASKQGQPEWTHLKLENAGDNGQRYIDMSDGSILAQGYAPTKFSTSLRGKTQLTNITAFRLELLNDPNLPCNGPGRSFKGTRALTEFTVEAVDAADSSKKQFAKFVKVTADYSNPERALEPNFFDKSDKKRVTGAIDFAIDGKDETAWGIDAGPGRRNQPRKAVFVAEQPVGFPGGTILNISLKQNHGGWNSDDHMNNNLGRFRISATTILNVTADPLSTAVRDIFAIPKEQRTAEQEQVLFSTWRTTVSEFQAVNDAIEALWRQWPEGATALVLAQRSQPRDTRMLQRGDFLKPDRPVTPGVPAFLHPLAETTGPMNRLTFAKWVVDRRSPTAARVMVNRIWQAYFGTGIVASAEDLGTQSETPSHPGLLDWLAVEFMDRGWKLKHIHRLIVTSATYRQSSQVSEEAYAIDQYNRLLARAPRLRVEGEIVRDVALAASGLLNRQIGGPSIYSPAPDFLFLPPASYGPFTWNEETGPNRYRRALYTFRRRSTPYPALQAFDTPNGDFSCVRRTRSNTPLQALTTLNETLFLECARALALTVLQQREADDTAKLAFAFRSCVSRPPNAAEQLALANLLAKQLKRFASGGQDPWQLAAKDPAKPPTLPEGITPNQLAAWTVISRVLLNLDETLTRE
jgi:hypothetical protein